MGFVLCALTILMSVAGLTEAFLNPRTKLFRPNNSLQEKCATTVHDKGKRSPICQSQLDPHAFVEHINYMTIAYDSIHNTHFETLLSTMYTTGIAHGHSNPWFGPPDPYLNAGKSIAPLGSSVPPPSAPTTDMPSLVKFFSNKGVPILDSSTITPENYLPGFTPTESILPAHRKLPPANNAAVFSAQVEWAANYMNVALKLPLAALVYAIVEFFFLRSDVDLYKSEIEQESKSALWADALSTVFVRIIAMTVIAVLTLAIFG